MGALSDLPHHPTEPGVELLERSIGYTHGTLATVRQWHLLLPTPCSQWLLGDLLAHMEDALDAFTEGAAGVIGRSSSAPAQLDQRLDALRMKACRLMGAWTGSATATVSVGHTSVGAGVITQLAAVEIAVHGWDVGRTTRAGPPLPDALAEALLPTALTVALEPAAQFGPPQPVAEDAGAAARLLALLGRRAT